jgi:hypothetical protein
VDQQKSAKPKPIQVEVSKVLEETEVRTDIDITILEELSAEIEKTKKKTYTRKTTGDICSC